MFNNERDVLGTANTLVGSPSQAVQSFPVALRVWVTAKRTLYFSGPSPWVPGNAAPRAMPVVPAISPVQHLETSGMQKQAAPGCLRVARTAAGVPFPRLWWVPFTLATVLGERCDA